VASALEFDAGVEVLRVLAHDHEIDVLVAGPDAGVGLARSDACVEISSLRSATFTLRKPVPTGVVIGPFRPTSCSEANRARAREAAFLPAGRRRCPLPERPTRTGRPLLRGRAALLGDFGPGSVARNQRDTMRPSSPFRFQFSVLS